MYAEYMMSFYSLLYVVCGISVLLLCTICTELNCLFELTVCVMCSMIITSTKGKGYVSGPLLSLLLFVYSLNHLICGQILWILGGAGTR